MFDQFAISIGVISLLITIINVTVTLVQRFNASRVAQKAIPESLFIEALDSNDIAMLRKYLYEGLGGIAITQYARNAQIAKAVDTYFEKLQTFTADATEPIQAPSQKLKQRPRKKKVALGVPKNPVTIEIVKIEKELETGEVWNALARLRRLIEMNLRRLAEARGIAAASSMSAGELNHMLSRSNIISKGTRQNLAFVINVCNKAIHGHTIERDIGRTAIDEAELILRKLQKA